MSHQIIDTISVQMGLVGVNSTTGVPTAFAVATNIVEPVPISETGTNKGGPQSSVNGGVFQCGDGGESAYSAVKLQFFGIGSNGNTFHANVYGWSLYKSVGASKFGLWVPTLLATFTGITLNTSITGSNDTDILATQFFASAITLGVGNSGISCEVVSPGAAVAEIAHAVVSTKGAKFLEVRFAMDTATSGNALWTRM
jgi:hypothetical protein